MIASAKRKEIDIILTKSISRFARNTVDALNHIRELRKINVEVIFEKENISSLDPKVDFLLTIMSSIAQEEARNTSENVKWNVQRRFRQGIPIVNTSRFLGYTKDKKGGNLVIVPEEAEIVKLIFKLYVSGLGPSKIVKHLMDIGAKTGAGKKLWRTSSITSILKNEKYMGNMLQQKTVSIDYLNHTRVKNKNHAPTYYIENSHEAIIDRETFLLAQRIRKDRAKTKVGKNKNLSKYNQKYPLSSMIICSQCGRTLKRRYWNYGKPSQRVMQQCGSYINGKDKCTAKASYQEIIEGATLQVLNEVFLNEIDIIETINSAIKKVIPVNDLQIQIDKLNVDKAELENNLSTLVDTKVKSPGIPDSIFNVKYGEYMNKIRDLTHSIKQLEVEQSRMYDTTQRIDKIKEFTRQKQGTTTKLDDSLKSFVFKMISVSPSEMVYCIAGTKNYSDAEFSERRKEFLTIEPIAIGTYYCEKYDKKMNYKVVVI
jgi:DNA invertase Pin-like site-specific DNA recombinase